MVDLTEFTIKGLCVGGEWGQKDLTGDIWQLKKEYTLPAIQKANSKFLPLEYAHSGYAIGYVKNLELWPDRKIWCEATVTPSPNWPDFLQRELVDIKAGRISGFSIKARFFKNYKTIYGIQEIMEISVTGFPAVAGSGFNSPALQAEIDRQNQLKSELIQAYKAYKERTY